MNPEETDSTWLVVVPMENLYVSDESPINGHWKVGDVTFHSRKSLDELLRPPRIRVELGSEQRESTFGKHYAFAVVKQQGKPDQIRPGVTFQVRQAALVLASTAAFLGAGRSEYGFSLSGYPTSKSTHHIFLDTVGTEWFAPGQLHGAYLSFALDKDWLERIRLLEIDRLFPVLNDETLDPTWRRQVTSAAARLGKSTTSLELADAFLDDVVGLETLLTRPRERNGTMLSRRIKGMAGWHLRQHRPKYIEEIKRIHEVRCEIVHDSDYSNLTVELLLQADLYLKNCLLNVVRLPKLFPSKDALVRITDEYAEKENWPTDDSVEFRWVVEENLSQNDRKLMLW